MDLAFTSAYTKARTLPLLHPESAAMRDKTHSAQSSVGESRPSHWQEQALERVCAAYERACELGDSETARKLIEITRTLKGEL